MPQPENGCELLIESTNATLACMHLKMGLFKLQNCFQLSILFRRERYGIVPENAVSCEYKHFYDIKHLYDPVSNSAKLHFFSTLLSFCYWGTVNDSAHEN